MAKITKVSAPGKILFAGGYLVLESPNVGYVVAADKRFYSTITSQSVGDAGNDGENTTTITVDSPQFHSKWTYRFTAGSNDDNDNDDDDGDCSLTPASGNASNNPFVEKSLRIVLAFLKDKCTIESMDITIQADNDFYSIIPHLEGQERTLENIGKLGTFLNCPQDPTTGKAIINKTGLGSSAALTTSLVGALYEHYLPPQKETAPSEDDKDRMNEIHNLAQICHCHAQGKVGSGFDVSAAMHGSHLYRRFPKCTLPDLLQGLGRSPTSISSGTCRLLDAAAQQRWVRADSPNPMTTPLPIPAGLQVMLADVCGGSESPSMARKVLAWKREQRGVVGADGDIPHWDVLKETNMHIAKLLQDLAKETIDAATLSTLPASEWPKTLADGSTSSSTQLLIELHQSFLTTRRQLKAMGDSAGVPIEPAEQTEICDATMQLPGVVAALVPGAGGYDAVACLYIDTEETKNGIGKLWSEWNKNGQIICPLAVQATHQGLQVHF